MDGNLNTEIQRPGHVQTKHASAHTMEEPLIIPPQFVFLMFVMVIVLQCLVQVWKKHHPKSYNLTTLFLMWLFPALICFSLISEFWKFAITWIIYTGMTAYVTYLASRKTLKSNTPRKVYAWFFLIFGISHFLIIVGGTLFMIQFLGVFELLPFVKKALDFLYVPAPAVLLFYGLYYGVLVRDCAEVCADQMANNMEAMRNKFYESASAVHNKCGICDNDLDPAVAEADDEAMFGAPVQSDSNLHNFTLKRMKGKQSSSMITTLPNCKHQFHEFCIRGWVIVGKKDTCPVCKEKVDYQSALSKNPWESDSLIYIQLLDMTRYFVAWNPLILVIMVLFVNIVVKLTGHSRATV